ncbi:EscT/YscT/HrcT family type III secretion system export apparatus protein [Planctomycetota bacterium]
MNEELAQLGINIDVSLHLRIFALVLGRMIGMTIPIPFIGGKLVPARIRFGIPLFLSVFLYPFLSAPIPHHLVPPVGFVFVGIMAKEIFVGYAIGFVISLPFAGITSAGSFMDTQRGQTFAQVLAPLTGGMTSLLGQFLSMLFMTLFLTIGGMQIVLDALLRSYLALPMLAAPGAMQPNSPAVLEFIRFTADVFTVAVQFGAPVVIAMFLTDATLGIVNRAAPNIQVFFLGMPVKALGGIVVALIILGTASEYFVELMLKLAAEIRQLLVLMSAT